MDLTKQELEMAEAMEQLNAQIGYFRDRALRFENAFLKKKTEESVWQLVILSLLVDQKLRGIDINVETFERLKRYEGMKLRKQWNKDGSLTVKLVEQTKN